MEFDLSKENVQPLRGGRNVSQLNAALQAQSDMEFQKGLLQQKEEFESQIREYEGTDPLDLWYNYISWVEQSYPKHGHEGNLTALLEECISKFENDPRYAQDRRFCKIFIKFIDFQQNPLELYKAMYDSGRGTECADLYRAWAYYYEALSDFKRADGIFQLGFKNNAQPEDELSLAYNYFTFAVGQHCLRGESDMDQLAEKRKALTSLRTFKQKHRTIVPSQRTGANVINLLPGTFRPGSASTSVQSRSNQQVAIFQDNGESESLPGPSGSASKPNSILDRVTKREIHKENTLKAGPWNSAYSKKPVVSQGSNLNFTVHKDVLDEQMGFIYHPRFVNHSKETFENFKPPLFVPDPEDPTKISQYKFDELYCNNIEYSFEEIRARKYFKSKVQPDNTMPQTFEIHEDTPTPNTTIVDLTEETTQHQFVQNKSQLNSENEYQATGYTTPLKMRLSDLKVSSPPNNTDSGTANETVVENGNNKSVINLLQSFNSASENVENVSTRRITLLESRNSIQLPQNTLDEVAKAVDSIPGAVKDNWMTIPNNIGNQSVIPNVNPVQVHNESATVCTKEAMWELDDLWGAKPNILVPKENKLYFEDETQHYEINPPNPTAFTIYSETNHFEDNTYKNAHHQPNYQNEEVGFKVHNNSVTYYPAQQDFAKQRQSIDPRNMSHHHQNSPQLQQVHVPQIQHRQSVPFQPHEYHHPASYHQNSPQIYHHAPQQQNHLPTIDDNFEETVSTQVFNYNINTVSTPINQKIQQMNNHQAHYEQNSALYYPSQPNMQNIQNMQNMQNHSIRHELFPQYPEIQHHNSSHLHYDLAVNSPHKSFIHQDQQLQHSLHQSPQMHQQHHILPQQCPDTNVKLQQSKSESKLSVILEETKEYKSGSSTGSDNMSGNKKMSHSRASRDTYGMEYEVGEAMLQLSQENPQRFHIYSAESKDSDVISHGHEFHNTENMYIDQNSKHSTDSGFDVRLPQEMMDWDEQSNSVDYNIGCQTLSTLLASDKPIDPFESRVIDALLKKARFPNLRHKDRFERIQNITKLSVKEVVHVRNEKYLVEKVLGKGTYGTVYKAINQNDGTPVALKFQKPPNYWEFYICREIQHRIKDSTLLLSFMDVTKGYFSKVSSLFVSEFTKYGSLLTVANKIKQVTGKCLKEIVIYHFVIEMIQIISALHQCQIIHADIKPDNFLVMSIGPNTDRLSLQLIDFGCSIDMTLFPSDIRFYKKISTEDFTCVEMREGKPWTYQTDLYCMAATAYVLLLGEYMQVKKFEGMWTIAKRLPRYVSADVWNHFFMQLLNIESCDALPDLGSLQSHFQGIVNEKHCDLSSELRYIANILNGR